MKNWLQDYVVLQGEEQLGKLSTGNASYKKFIYLCQNKHNLKTPTTYRGLYILLIAPIGVIRLVSNWQVGWRLAQNCLAGGGRLRGVADSRHTYTHTHTHTHTHTQTSWASLYGAWYRKIFGHNWCVRVCLYKTYKRWACCMYIVYCMQEIFPMSAWWHERYCAMCLLAGILRPYIQLIYLTRLLHIRTALYVQFDRNYTGMDWKGFKEKSYITQ